MAIVRIEIALGKAPNQIAKTITIDPDELTLGFNEDIQVAQESGKWRDMNSAFAELLGLSHAEIRQVTNRQFREIATAIRTASDDAVVVPNE